jgi:hypothetical protein
MNTSFDLWETCWIKACFSITCKTDCTRDSCAGRGNARWSVTVTQPPI